MIHHLRPKFVQNNLRRPRIPTKQMVVSDVEGLCLLLSSFQGLMPSLDLFGTHYYSCVLWVNPAWAVGDCERPGLRLIFYVITVKRGNHLGNGEIEIDGVCTRMLNSNNPDVRIYTAFQCCSGPSRACGREDHLHMYLGSPELGFLFKVPLRISFQLTRANSSTQARTID